MRNIGRIFRDDLRLVRGSIVSVLVVLGLCLAPAVYAWVSVAGSWDPLGNTGRLKVAVSNSDDGYESALMPVRLNIGERVVGMLRESDSYDWTFVDEQEALEGVRSGEYYAAMTIPRDFSSKMMSVLSSDAEQADVGFYLNTKENPDAPVLAGAGGAAVDEGIRAKFSEAVDEMALGLASDLVSFAGGGNARDFGARLVAHLDETAEDLDSLAEQVRSFSDLAGASASIAETASDALASSQKVADASGKVVDNVSGVLDAAVDSGQSAVADIQQQVNSARESGGLGSVGTEAASDLASDVSKLASSVATVSRETNTMANSLNEATRSLSGSSSSVAGSLESVRDQLGIAANKLNASSAKIRKFQDDVASAIAKGNLSDVATIIGGRQAVLAQWLAEPVQVEQRVVYPVESFGSSVAPFYSVLSIWACAVLLVLLVKVGVSGERLGRYQEDCGRPVKNYEQYLGHYPVFALLVLLQATIVGLGDLLFLRVQCAQPLLFMAVCWACALVFSCLAYTIAVSFGNVGKALCVVLLALPAAGAGTEYPAQMMGDVFQAINLALPFTYGIRALQSAVAGVHGMEYAYDLLFLSAFLLPCLLLGLALRRPLLRAADHFAAKVKETGLM